MTIRALVADDSDIAAATLESILEEDPGIRVVGRARTGAELLGMPAVAIADVVLLDMLMPELDGLSVIRAVTAHAGVVVVSSLPRDSPVVREALAQGASDAFTKRELGGEDGRARLRAAARESVKLHAARAGWVFLLAGSTGAIPALESLSRGLGRLSVPVLVVQHMLDQRERDLARTLCGMGAPARLARSGDALTPEILLAPSGYHMELDARERVRLTSGPPVRGHKPSAEMLIRSAVPLAQRAVVFVLSGLGNDGAGALAELADKGGLCFAQDQAECSAKDMPQAALAASRRVQSIRVQDFLRFAQRVVGRAR